MSGGVAVPHVLECEGAPRDLGLDQGLALRDWLRRFAASQGAELPPDEEVPDGALGLPWLERVASGVGGLLRGSARARPGGAATRALARDLARHFPQLAERCEGLARGGRIPASVVLDVCTRELEREAGAALLAATPDGGGLFLLRGLRAETSLRWRRSRPENGLRSLELVAPAGLGAVAGVNEAGLAVAWGARGARPAPVGAARCAAPATLLVQECLQRFERVAGAAAWCADRPALGGEAGGDAISLLIADASGACAGVTRSGDGGAASFEPVPVALASATATLAGDTGGVLAVDVAGRCACLLRSASALGDAARGALGWLAVAPPEAG